MDAEARKTPSSVKGIPPGGRGSLHRRFLIASLAMAVAFGLVSALASYRRTLTDHERHGHQLAQLSIRLMRSTAALPLVAGDTERLEALCQTVLASSRTFAAVGVRDARGRLVVHAGPLPDSFDPSARTPLLHRGALRMANIDGDAAEGGDPPVGWVDVLESASYVRARSREVFAQHAQLTLLLVAVLLLAGQIVLRRVVRPLEELGATAQRIASGDLEARVDAGLGGEEVARLAVLFNDMAEHLQERNARLRQAHDELEDKVLERTAELEGKNRENSRLVAAVNAAAEGICVTDARGKILYVNPAFESLVGVEDEDVLGRHPFEVLCPDQAEELLPQALRGLELTGRWERRILGRRRNGTPLLFDLTLSAVRDDGGNLVHLVGIGRDVTRLNAMEESLREARRLEAIGRLAGGIAHDFNNVLTVMKGNAEYVRDRLGPEHPNDHDLHLIVDYADRAGKLVQQLLAFSSRQIQEPRRLELGAIVRNTLPILRRTVGENVQLELELDENVDPVLADPTQLEQVIMNLVVNARDAMADTGGRVTVSTESLHLAEAGGGPLAGVPEGRWVVLRVSDTGPGMDAETQAKVFEPYFSTKHTESRARGWGLASVYGIVRQHGGYVTVESRPRQGATFRVLLPRHDGPLPQIETAEDLELRDDLPAQGREIVLFVEDEDMIRQVLARKLEALGYEVLPARDAEEAIELVMEHAEPYDVLVTDVLLPGMNGARLAEYLAAGGRGRPVLFVSGYSGDADECPVTLPPDAAFLRKPFDGMVLARRLRMLLDGPSQRSG